MCIAPNKVTPLAFALALASCSPPLSFDEAPAVVLFDDAPDPALIADTMGQVVAFGATLRRDMSGQWYLAWGGGDTPIVDEHSQIVEICRNHPVYFVGSLGYGDESEYVVDRIRSMSSMKMQENHAVLGWRCAIRTDQAGLGQDQQNRGN